MIQEFENRLAVVLGDQLAAPFADRVFVADQEPGDNGVKVLVGAVHHQPWTPEFGTTQHEQIPGQQDFRRVLRLAVEVAIQVKAASDQGRQQRRQGLDQLLFLLDQPTIRNGSDLATIADQGFFIDELNTIDSQLPLVNNQDTPSEIRCLAKGWFWPAGQPGQAGIAIQETHIRANTLNVELVPRIPAIVAGGPAVNLGLHVRHTGFVLEQDQQPQPLGLDLLALNLRAAGGGPGQGALQGDDLGLGGLTLVTVSASGIANFAYTPPAQPGEDILEISLAKGGAAPAEKHAGTSLGKLSLSIGAP